MYRPTHVILPMGPQTTMSPFDAAYICRNLLSNCHTVIPMLFKMNDSPNFVAENSFRINEQ